MPDHLILWAKTARRTEADGYHPLICHMIDAAMVARCLWDEVVTPAVRSSLAAGFGLSELDTRSWTILLTALHDLGKATPVFQCKSDEAIDRLTTAGLTFPLDRDDPGHGRTGAALLEPLLEEEFNWHPRTATQVALAIGGHHGAFPGDTEFQKAGLRQYVGRPPWSEVRSALITGLIQTLGPPPDRVPKHVTHPGTMVLAGLVSVADWIASDEQFFAYAATSSDGPPDGFDLNGYLTNAERIAHDALAALGWLNWYPDDAQLEFADLFPEIARSPRPVQQRIAKLPGIVEQPGIAIVELPMGEGKTEAAFYLADRWGAKLGQRGVYIAMPTMATANQMFSRTSAFLKHRYPGHGLNVQLIHSHAALETDVDTWTDDAPPVQPTQLHSDDPAETAEQAIARSGEWFTRRKRGLLAPFGVGTVDQSFLAALQTKHVFVRLFGLAGKTVIFDEIHAYDAYMNRVFERLLEWLAALGSSVIILSATLPDQRRKALIDGYARGRDGESPGEIQSADYPRISWLGPSGGMAEPVPVSAHSSRGLGIEWVDGDPAALREYLWNELADGGCAAVICNTVGRAQEVYAALKPIFPHMASDGEPELDLFHARYPFQERMNRENRALRRFGKPGGAVDLPDGESVPVQRPHRAVLVATQVVEQSLDLDFDLMVTDLAPADLVLQRSGRLHRHDRGADRPPSLAGQPVIRIAQPEIEDGAPAFGNADTYIYDEHVLLRSWLVLQGRGVIWIPEDVGPLIESVYAADAVPTDLDEVLLDTWHRTRSVYEKQLEKDQREAEYRWIKSPYYSELINQVVVNPRAEDEPEFHQDHQALTRLGGPSVSIVCLHGDPDRPTLDKQGRYPVLLNRVPDFPVARELLRQSVNLSDGRIVKHLLQNEPPSHWQRSALLRRQHPVVFDSEGLARGLPVRLRLDPELGLFVEREEGDNA